MIECESIRERKRSRTNMSERIRERKRSSTKENESDIDWRAKEIEFKSEWREIERENKVGELN